MHCSQYQMWNLGEHYFCQVPKISQIKECWFLFLDSNQNKCMYSSTHTHRQINRFNNYHPTIGINLNINKAMNGIWLLSRKSASSLYKHVGIDRDQYDLVGYVLLFSLASVGSRCPVHLLRCFTTSCLRGVASTAHARSLPGHSFNLLLQWKCTFILVFALLFV